MAVNRQTRIKTTHPVSGESMILSMEHLKVAGVVWQGDSPVLRLPRVLPANLYSEATWSGRSFHTVGRRVLSSLNLITGTSGAIADAVSHLAANDGDLSGWLTAEGIRQRDGDRQSEQYYDGIDQPRVLLSALPDERRLALEMWLNESVERRWLEGELTLLEREWREAEKLAKIADDLVLDDSSG